MSEASTIGTRIRMICAEQRISIAALSRKSNVSRTCIWELINGVKSPSIETISRLAAALDVHVSKIVGAPSDKPKVIQILEERDGTLATLSDNGAIHRWSDANGGHWQKARGPWD